MNQLIKTHFVYFLIGAMILGFLVPGPFAFLSSLTIPILGAIMVFSFLSMDYRLLLAQLKRPRDIAVVFVITKILLPAALFFAIKPFNPILAVAVLLITAAPAAAVSPTLTSLCRGDMEFILVILTVTTVLAPITLPLTINLLAGTSIDIDVRGMVITLVQIIIAPLAIALLLKRFFERPIERVKPYLSSAAVVLLAVLLLGIVAKGSPEIRGHLDLAPGYLLLAFILGTALTLLGWFLFPFLDKGKRIGLAICTSYINVGLVIVLASRYFPVEVMIFSIIFEIPVNIIPEIVKRIAAGKKELSE